MLSESNKIPRNFACSQLFSSNVHTLADDGFHGKPSLAAARHVCIHFLCVLFCLVLFLYFFFTFARGFPSFMFGIYFSFASAYYFFIPLLRSTIFCFLYDCVSLIFIFQLHRSRTEEELRQKHSSYNVKSNSVFCLCFFRFCCCCGCCCFHRKYGIFCGLFFASALLTYT